MRNILKLLRLGSIVAFLILSTSSYASKRALVIGIGDYPNVSKLIGPQLDAQNIKRLLVSDLGFKEKDIKLLLDKQASRKGMMNAVDSWLINGTNPGDEVVFYYSGHGFQIADENGDEQDNKDEAIAAYDAMVKDGKVVNMISDDEMDYAFNRLSDRSVTVIIDSCHSGTLTRGRFDSVNASYEKTIPAFNNLAKQSRPTKSVVDAHRKEESFIEETPNRVVWTAVSAWQKALVDFESKKGSVFTNYFIKGVQKKSADLNSDKIVTRAELLKYIRDESQDFCDRNKKFCRAGLTPTLEVSKDLYVEDATNFSNHVTQISQTSNANYVDQSFTVSAPIVAGAKPVVSLTAMPLKTNYKVDDIVEFSVKSSDEGYLLFLDISQTGDVVQLYPFSNSERNAGGLVRKGQIIKVKSRATRPVGIGKLVAILSKDKVMPEAVTNSSMKDLIVENPKAYLQDVTQALNAVWTGGQSNRAVDWSVSKIDYAIID